MGTQNFPYRKNFVWGHKIPPIGNFLCGDIKFPLYRENFVGTQNSPYRENFVWGHKISPPKDEKISILCLILLIQSAHLKSS